MDDSYLLAAAGDAVFEGGPFGVIGKVNRHCPGLDDTVALVGGGHLDGAQTPLGGDLLGAGGQVAHQRGELDGELVLPSVGDEVDRDGTQLGFVLDGQNVRRFGAFRRGGTARADTDPDDEDEEGKEDYGHHFFHRICTPFLFMPGCQRAEKQKPKPYRFWGIIGLE